jgi:2-polyprenyl-6-methoxyphenol hydroxylase-like FAD-dependent oxidoreductase/protein-S-isoprenylcysteine O-methyltransferase Ste14
MSQPPSYTPVQRWMALAIGLAGHALFAASVAVMFVSLYHGLAWGEAKLSGWPALAANTALAGQFALGHSLLLSDRGRRLMARLTPLGLGRDLATTVFAAFASLQLLLVFLLWSPSGVLWVAPEGIVRQMLAGLYAVSWLLLAKSMQEAGLGVQLGLTGWHSVWRGRRPTYPPFPRGGLYRHTRQPIYLSFTLILWTAPDWTPDRLLLTLAWTAYCVLAPVLKERRYLRWYGAAFARYQKAVPYWLPGRARDTYALPEGPIDHDLAIVGAGPVGLLLAGLAARHGLRVLIVDKRTQAPALSQAIGITPPSLEILARLGLEQDFLRSGVPIRDCRVHGACGQLGMATFRELPGPRRFILSLPQRTTVELLEAAVTAMPGVTLRRGLEVTGLEQDAGSVTLRGEGFEARSRWLAACDGHRSPVRELLRLRVGSGDYGSHFVMGDFIDRSDLGTEAQLWFTPEGAIESFPLPEGRRRWIAQLDQPAGVPVTGRIPQLVAARAGLTLADADQLNESGFSPRWLAAERYVDGRVILCGDAAHVMSPIGGQGMNTGWADAEFLADALAAIERAGREPAPLLAAYEHCRQRASRAATRRAASGMWLGTRTGKLASRLRDVLLRFLLNRPVPAHWLARRFAMLTIPCGSVRRLPARLRARLSS